MMTTMMIVIDDCFLQPMTHGMGTSCLHVSVLCTTHRVYPPDLSLAQSYWASSSSVQNICAVRTVFNSSFPLSNRSDGIPGCMGPRNRWTWHWDSINPGRSEQGALRVMSSTGSQWMQCSHELWMYDSITLWQVFSLVILTDVVCDFHHVFN